MSAVVRTVAPAASPSAWGHGVAVEGVHETSRGHGRAPPMWNWSKRETPPTQKCAKAGRRNAHLGSSATKRLAGGPTWATSGLTRAFTGIRMVGGARATFFP